EGDQSAVLNKELGRTYLPLRAVAEYLGAEVEWEPEGVKGKNVPEVHIKKDGRLIVVPIGLETAWINDKQTKIGAPAYIEEAANRTMVPLRFVSEALGAEVEWDGENKAVYIIDPDKPITPGKPITEEELVNKVVETYQKIETAKFDTNMTTKVEFQVEEITGSFEMITTGSGILDNVNQDLYMKMNTEMNLPQPQIDGLQPAQPEKMNMLMETYLIDNIMYSKTDMKIDGDSIMPAEWIKMEMPQDYYSTMGIDALVQILKASEIEFLPDEKINGTECYVVKLTPDIEKFREIIMNQMNMFGTEMLTQGIGGFQGMENLGQMFKNLDITYWIAKDTFYPVKEHANMTIVLNPEILNTPDMPGNFEMKMDIEMTSTYHSYNEPVTIELPEEAKSAKCFEEMFEVEELEGTVKQVNPAEKTILLNTPEGNEVVVQIADNADIISMIDESMPGEPVPVTFESIKPGQQIIVDGTSTEEGIKKAAFIMIIQ
ncbi:copper amine oxidase N-terminal domain-containing protein, partial [Peptococcaceae bacterium]|nr:copper amine oxidase N-terminal domain-containing protein [Peptococcaceae bacterium]